MKGFLVAGTSSGVGKTTVALAIMAALRKRGFAVQPFKCGPDFLDTGHHSQVCGRVSRNLDTWMLNADENREAFAKASVAADVVIAEGMMGLFDGVAGSSEAGSSAEIAKLLGLPVVLVTDAAMSARSLAAVVRGFEVFDPELRLAGVVLNNVGGDSHFRMIEESIMSASQVPVLGWLPREPAIAIPERHLGLHSAIEQVETSQRICSLAALAERHLKISHLLEILPELSPVSSAPPRQGEADAGNSAAPVRLGVARDRAFQFYYEDNLDLLRESGAEIVPFSPISDEMLPPDLDGLYLGGGYPELYAEQLSGNRQLLDHIRKFAQAKPVYAECGGMLYLAQELKTSTGERYPMAGIVPLAVEMTGHLVDFGYVDVEFTRDCILGPRSTAVRGHSFHYSRAVSRDAMETAYRVTYSLSRGSGQEGYCRSNLLASYIHLHFRAHRALACSFVNSIRASSTAKAPA
jgi:cobyrinic acid a,c-diamide synthase